ncbi:hypothetical protein NW762_014458 [Fusarium torreyae]|uniref:Uncharacterized protein n=1 Tax=Fusarium torreyae TaxID=1237075 RepID=A0A9W8RKC7_9HYPO|nr:hypothetical protein NW762_014458 [Fusarium torreyae]
MSTSTSPDPSQLAKFRADYFAIPISEFTSAINKAMLAAVPTTRHNHVKAILEQYSYDSLTELDIESIFYPRDILVGYDGSLDLGSSLSTKLSSTIVIDNQSDYWTQWNVTAGKEWYIAQFSTNFNTTLQSTATTISGFHCVVDTNGQQTNTPVSAECSQIKANTGDNESDVEKFFKEPRLDAAIALTGLMLLKYWYKRHKGTAEGNPPPPSTVQEEANCYEERVKIITQIASIGENHAAEESLAQSRPAERQELHTEMQAAIKRAVDLYFAKSASVDLEPTQATVVTPELSTSCQDAVSSVLSSWCSTIVNNHPSGLQQYVISYMVTECLMTSQDLQEIGTNVLGCTKDNVFRAFDVATETNGHGAGFEAAIGKYLQLELAKRQLNAIQTKLLNDGKSVEDAAAALSSANQDVEAKGLLAQDLAEKYVQAQKNASDTAALQAAKTASQNAEAAAEAAQTDATAKKAALQTAEYQNTALQKEKDDIQEGLVGLESEIKKLNIDFAQSVGRLAI